MAALNAEGRTVFVDFTAAWCVTCQVNKRTTLADAAVLADFDAQRVALLRADWTRRDAAISAELARLGRNGVPVYALYRAGQAQPTLLPELLSVQTVRDALAASREGVAAVMMTFLLSALLMAATPAFAAPAVVGQAISRSDRRSAVAAPISRTSGGDAANGSSAAAASTPRPCHISSAASPACAPKSSISIAPAASSSPLRRDQATPSAGARPPGRRRHRA